MIKLLERTTQLDRPDRPDVEFLFADGNDRLDSRINWTHGLTCTVTDRDRVLQTLSANQPRHDYNPATGDPRGGLVEAAKAANLVTQPEDFSHADWTKTRCSISADAKLAVDGNVTADELIEDNTASNTHRLNYPITKAAAAITYTWSVYAEANTRDEIWLEVDDNVTARQAEARFDLINGTTSEAASNGGGFTAVSSKIEDAGGGIYRCSLTYTTNSETINNLFIGLHNGVSHIYSGDGVSSAYVWGADLDESAFPTSYNGTAARAEDNLLISDISQIYADTGITVSSEFIWWGGTTAGIVSFTDGSVNNVINSFVGSDKKFRVEVVSGGVTQGNIVFDQVLTAGQSYKAAWRVGPNDFEVALEGAVSGLADTSITMPVGMDELSLSKINGTFSVNGRRHHKRLAVYKSLFGDSNLAELAA